MLGTILGIHRFLVLIAALGAGLANAQSAPIPIRIGWLPDANGAFFVAKSQKLFEKVGLQPNYFKFLSGPATFAALQSDSIDVTEFGVSAFVAGVANGIEMVAIGVAYDDAKVNLLVARPGSGIKAVRDLKGKKVAATRGSLSFLGLAVALQKNQLTFKDIDFRNVPVTAMIPAFQNADIDAAWTWEPWAQRMVAEGGQVVASLNDVGVGGDVWAARKEWLKQQPEAAIRFIQALDLAAQMIRRDPALTTADVTEAFAISPAMARDIMSQVETPTVSEQLDPESKYSVMHFATGKKGLAASIKTTAEFFIQQDVIKSFPPIESVFDTSPMTSYAKTIKR